MGAFQGEYGACPQARRGLRRVADPEPAPLRSTATEGSTSLDLMSEGLTAEDLAVRPVDELAPWLLRSLRSGEEATFHRTATIDRLVRQLAKKLPRNKAYHRTGESDDVPHLAKALAEAWAWLSINGLLAES